MRLRGAVKLPIFALSFAARTCHAWLARLTRARGRRFLRGWKILLNDFWYFWSRKSTIKEKLLYVKDNTSSVSLWLTPFSLWLGHARVLTALGLSFIPLAPLRYPLEKAFIRFFFCIYRRKRKSYQKENAGRGLTHMRSMCVGVAETG